MSKKKKNQMLDFEATPSDMPDDESGIVVDETGTAADKDIVRLTIEPILKPASKKKTTQKKSVPKSLTKDGKSKRLVLPKQTKSQPQSLQEMAINFSRGLKRGISQLRIIKKGA